MSNKIQVAAQIVASARHLLALTGAGISAASGIPTFRGSFTSLWRNRHLRRFAQVQTFISDPQDMCDAHETMRTFVRACQPNAAHLALHRLSELRHTTLFTQNVDGLHGKAGDEAFELHGSLHKLRCCRCSYSVHLLSEEKVSSFCCPKCGNWLRHGVVWFGESVQHLGELEDAVSDADVLLFIGTSGTVTDTQYMAQFAREQGKAVIEINPALWTPATRYTTISLRQPAEKVLPLLIPPT